MALQDFFSGIIAPGSNPADPTSPDSILRRRKIAEALLKQGTDYSPVQHPLQGLARVANALYGGFEDRMADQQEKANNDYWNKQIGGIIGGGDATALAAPAAASAAGPTVLPSARFSSAPAEIKPLIAQVAQETGIPEAVLTAQVAQESGFNPNARGKAGEIGLMQIMPSTARDPGFGLKGVDVASLNDPLTNLRFGAQYLKARGGGDLSSPSKVAMALANYNGGGDPNYVQNVTRRMAPGAPMKVASADPNFVPGTGAVPKAQPEGVQVAQAAPAGGMIGLGQSGGPAQAQAGPTAQQLLAIIANPNAPAGVKQVAMLKYQQMQKDPMQEAKLAETRANTAKIIQDMAMAGKTGDQKDYEYAKAQGYPGSFNQFVTDIKKAGAGNITMTTERRGQELMTQKGVEFLDAMSGASRDATRRIATYGQMAEAMQGFQPGASADARLALQRWLKDAGITDGKEVAPAEAFKAIQRRLELAATPRGQGQITENERTLIRDTIPTLTNSPESIGLILKNLQRLDEYDIKVAQIARESARKNGGVPNYLDIQDEIAKLGPPIDDNQLAALQSLKQRAAPPQAGAPQQEQSQGERKTLRGKTYEKRNGEWYEVQ